VRSSCGADYAKDEAITKRVKSLNYNPGADWKNTSVSGFAIDNSRNVLEIEGPSLEKKLSIITIPAMLAITLLHCYGDATFTLSNRDAKMFFLRWHCASTFLMIAFDFGKQTQFYKGGLWWVFFYRPRLIFRYVYNLGSLP
jgi:hypothetical protein